MADNVQIKCINKTDRTSAHERIRNVGGVNPSGTRWKLSVPEAISGIKAGKWRFFCERPQGDKVWVVIQRSAAGNEYLKTEADGDQPNNLLSLPECP
ncbi:MAG TPA: DUF3892 domain-containing protein [Devosiaceae bacterium]|jgi:hypothetical protein|nr:DUF3892 domain-containing protein [Devosiaceae bacterium]